MRNASYPRPLTPPQTLADAFGMMGSIARAHHPRCGMRPEGRDGASDRSVGARSMPAFRDGGSGLRRAVTPPDTENPPSESRGNS